MTKDELAAYIAGMRAKWPHPTNRAGLIEFAESRAESALTRMGEATDTTAQICFWECAESLQACAQFLRSAPDTEGVKP